ncbi:MAG: T9SS type A sorting domain-containing protein, partial [Bacteroidota bacterium]
LILDRKRSPTAEVAATIVSSEDITDQPNAIALNQNYPNPFNPTTTIPFVLSQPMAISLEVYDVLGRKIQTLIQNEYYGVGAHTIHFNAQGLSSGLYYYRLRTGQTEIIRSMTLIK